MAANHRTNSRQDLAMDCRSLEIPNERSGLRRKTCGELGTCGGGRAKFARRVTRRCTAARSAHHPIRPMRRHGTKVRQDIGRLFQLFDRNPFIAGVGLGNRAGAKHHGRCVNAIERRSIGAVRNAHAFALVRHAGEPRRRAAWTTPNSEHRKDRARRDTAVRVPVRGRSACARGQSRSHAAGPRRLSSPGSTRRSI